VSDPIDPAVLSQASRMNALAEKSRRAASWCFRSAFGCFLIPPIVVVCVMLWRPGFAEKDRELILHSNSTTQQKMSEFEQTIRTTPMGDKEVINLKGDIAAMLDDYKLKVYDVEQNALKEPSWTLAVVVTGSMLSLAGVLLWAFKYYSSAAAKLDHRANELLRPRETVRSSSRPAGRRIVSPDWGDEFGGAEPAGTSLLFAIVVAIAAAAAVLLFVRPLIPTSAVDRSMERLSTNAITAIALTVGMIGIVFALATFAASVLTALIRSRTLEQQLRQNRQLWTGQRQGKPTEAAHLAAAAPQSPPTVASGGS
jgi:hypothetical protein